ncbi:hypothetical protein [Vibrio rhizosphaerae]|uniref:hypothetical protein n=1 Tax=Vibrio rhizosphaerae TaxID=398736 RepID=UPI000571AC30|nr:hypothetical protein [Vibrio rhizosphaerae]
MPAILPQSLEALSAQTVIVGGELDQTIPPKLQILPYITTYQNRLTYKEIKGASHFSFMQNCKPQAIEILVEEGAAFVCQEAGRVDRMSIHQALLDIVEQQKAKIEL